MKHTILVSAAIGAILNASLSVAGEIAISDAKLHTEGVDVAQDGRIFVGSLLDSSVWVVPADGSDARRFTEPGSLGMDSAVGIKVDERANKLFVCSGPVLGVSKFAETAQDAGILVYDLKQRRTTAALRFPGRRVLQRHRLRPRRHALCDRQL